jgi:hypothetical protein
MKKQACGIFTTLSLFAVLVASAPVYAQSGTRIGRAHIPFNFSVSNKTLPAGEYTVERAIRGSDLVLLIRSLDGRQSAMVSTMGRQSPRAIERGKLVFNRYGSQYFLSQVWSGGETLGREVIKSRTERALERELRARAAGRESVTIALNR